MTLACNDVTLTDVRRTLTIEQCDGLAVAYFISNVRRLLPDGCSDCSASSNAYIWHHCRPIATCFPVDVQRYICTGNTCKWRICTLLCFCMNETHKTPRWDKVTRYFHNDAVINICMIEMIIWNADEMNIYWDTIKFHAKLTTTTDSGYWIVLLLTLYRIRENYYNWLDGTVVRTLFFDRRTFPVPRSTYGWRLTTNVGKPSATCQPTRPTQSFILPRSINWVVSYIGCVLPRSGGAVWWMLTE